MTVPNFTNAELIDFLTNNGCSVVSNDFFDEHDRIILKKDEHTFAIQFLSNYKFPYVIKLCETLGIEPPEDHKKCYEQWHEQVLAMKNQNPPK